MTALIIELETCWVFIRLSKRNLIWHWTAEKQGYKCWVCTTTELPHLKLYWLLWFNVFNQSKHLTGCIKLNMFLTRKYKYSCKVCEVLWVYWFRLLCYFVAASSSGVCGPRGGRFGSQVLPGCMSGYLWTRHRNPLIVLTCTVCKNIFPS